MTTPLHLLILEDSNTDAELIVSHLRQAGYELDWRQVTSREDFLAALDDDLDLILADYHLPKWDAMQALHLLKEKGIDIPVIVVTGAISEEVAVACMKEGASDYLIKDRLQRLGSAVAQVLENKKLQEQKRAFESALLHAAEEWRRTFDAMSDMITVQDADFRIIRANRAIVDALGISFQDILGKHCYQVIHDLSCPIVDCPSVRTKRTGKSEDAIIWEPKLGKWLMVRSSPILDEEGNFKGVVHAMRDVSQNKAIEDALRESEERYRRLLDTSLVGIFIIQNGEVKYCNRGLAEIFGYDSPVQIQGKTIQELVYAEDYPHVVQAIEGTDPATTGARHYRFRGVRADGSLVHVDTLGQTIEYDSKPATQGFLIDMTAQVQAERERLVRGRQQAVIAKLGQLALAGTPLDELMDETVKMVAETLEVEFCKVLELQPDGNELLLKAGVGWQEGVVGQARVAVTVNSQAGYTLATYEPVIVEDFLFETRFQIPPLLNEHHV
ncbi:MAG: PAS domain S-box protein, partial [Chloroflexi bacterium]|nr:PAS domain S-box protein [Chloroflexota bacterium]